MKNLTVVEKQSELISYIIHWLQEEVEQNQDIVDAHENNENAIMTDGTDDIYLGRYECAEGLLDQISKWRKELDD